VSGHASILATLPQREVEELALWLIEQPAARVAREAARAIPLNDAIAQTANGRTLMERALDEWVMFLAMRVANRDPLHPKVIWGADNTARAWLGHVFPGALAAIENPDNTNREMRIDGGQRYELHGRFGANRSSFSLTMETMEGYHKGIGTHVDARPGGTIVADADGNFVVTVDSSPADGRDNHLQTVPGPLMLYARDSQFDWEQDLTRFELVVLDEVPPTPPDRNVLLDEFVQGIVPWVRFWCGFKDDFLDNPEPNQIVGPRGREGGWGFLAGGRFDLAPDEAVIVTATDGGADYTGFQIADPWTGSPDPAYRTVSRNKSQARPNPDGSYTYVVSLVEPGVYNWIDTAGLSIGWMLLRWQAVPQSADPSTFIRSVRHVKLADLATELPPGVPGVTLDERRAEIARRVRRSATRLA
jgi:hypothetical protein